MAQAKALGQRHRVYAVSVPMTTTSLGTEPAVFIQLLGRGWDEAQGHSPQGWGVVERVPVASMFQQEISRLQAPQWWHPLKCSCPAAESQLHQVGRWAPRIICDSLAAAKVEPPGPDS